MDDVKRHFAELGGDIWLYADATGALIDVLGFARALHVVETTSSERARAGRAAPHVLMPAYAPASLVSAVHASGCAARFYDVDELCAPVVRDVERLVDDETVAILVVYAFGFPIPSRTLRALAAIARRRGALLIEDCALTLDGVDDHGWPLGTLGDAAVFSLRKTLLLAEGGVLRTSTSTLRDFCARDSGRSEAAPAVRHYVRQLAKRAYVRLTSGADPLRLFEVDPVDPRDGTARETLALPASASAPVRRPSLFTEQRLRFVSLAEQAAARRRHFRYYAEQLPRTPWLEPLHAILPDGVTPSSFPVLVHGGRRDDVRRMLLSAGVVTGAGWPEAPFDDDIPRAADASTSTSGELAAPRDHGRARFFAERILELPVHQGLASVQLERAIEVLQALARGPSPLPHIVTTTRAA